MKLVKQNGLTFALSALLVSMGAQAFPLKYITLAGLALPHVAAFTTIITGIVPYQAGYSFGYENGKNGEDGLTYRNGTTVEHISLLQQYFNCSKIAKKIDCCMQTPFMFRPLSPLARTLKYVPLHYSNGISKGYFKGRETNLFSHK